MADQNILLLFARAASIFDQLDFQSSPNMKWKANAEVEDALASKLLSGVNLDFWRAPQHDFPPLKSSKMATNAIWLEQAQYRPQEGRWGLLGLLTRISFLAAVEVPYSGWGVCGLA